MPRIRIKDLNSQQGNRKALLWNRLMSLNLLVYTIKQPNSQTFILITSDEIVDKLLSTQTREKLKRDNFEVFTPPEYSANRTIVLRNIDSLISEVENEELKNDMERRNDWLKITEIIKIPNAPKILKVRVESTDMVKRAVETGVLIWNQATPPNSVQKEIYVFLTICYRCYSFDHKTEDCPTPNVAICSECSSPNHNYRNCTSTTKKCINCQGDHRTLAAKCPIRKNLLKEKEKTIRERSRSRSKQRSYAEAASSKTKETSKETAFGLSREDQVKISSSIQYAHMVEGVLPGTFNITVKEMYRLNGLPEVKFPNYTPPPNVDKDKIQEEVDKMIKAFEEAQRGEMEQNKEEGMEEEASRKRNITPSPQEQRQTKSRREELEIEIDEEETVVLTPVHHGSAQSLQSEHSVIDKTTQAQASREEKVDPRAVARKTAESYEKHVIQMKFCFIKVKETMIKRKEDPREVSRLLKEGKLKYVYTNSEYSESDCRAAWEKGYVNLRIVEIKNVSRDFFNEVEYNGKLIERKTTMTGTLRKK